MKVTAAVVVRRVVEDQLQVGAGGGERDLRVSLAAAAREPHLPLLWRPVPVPSVPHLNKNKKQSFNALLSRLVMPYISVSIWCLSDPIGEAHGHSHGKSMVVGFRSIQ